MKRIRLWIKWIVSSIFGLILLFFIGVFLFNIVATSIETKKIKDYGEKINIDEKKMNVLVKGEGEKTVVLLPGYGTGAPGLDYSSLIDELVAKEYKVVVVEPFGYGLSDDTKKARTSENSAKEVHEALEQLSITDYTLMVHSISGLYGLTYVNLYPEEVNAFVGIDSSVPNQKEEGDFPVKTYQFLNHSGLFRLLTNFSPEMLMLPPLDQKIQQQMQMISYKNFMNASQSDEAFRFKQNFEDGKSLSFPKNLPVLFYLASDSIKEDPSWYKLHEELLQGVTTKELKILNGSHYLHHQNAKEIVTEFSNFLTKNHE